MPETDESRDDGPGAAAPTTGSTTGSSTTGPSTGGSRDFERLALLGALVLIALCLVVRESRVLAPADDPAAFDQDSLVRVNIGGETRTPPPPRVPPPRPADGPEARRERHVDEPPGATPRTPAPSPRYYVVRSGDSLSRIAQRELGSAQRAAEIATLNGITNPDRIRAGQRLRLPAE